MKSSEKIKQLRAASGLGLLLFSRKCGVSLQTIVNSEKRGVKSITVAKKIAAAMNVDISDVL